MQFGYIPKIFVVKLKGILVLMQNLLSTKKPEPTLNKTVEVRIYLKTFNSKKTTILQSSLYRYILFGWTYWSTVRFFYAHDFPT